MSEHTNKEVRILDDFLDETAEQQSNRTNPRDSPYGYPNRQYAYNQPHIAATQKKNMVVLALLSVVLVVGIAILAIQILRPFDSPGNSPLNNNNGNFYQQGPQNGGNDGPYTYQNPGNGQGGDGPQFHIEGDPSTGGGQQRGQFRMKDGTMVQRRTRDGITEYSTDDGKTWSEIAPEGMPPPPNHTPPR